MRPNTRMQRTRSSPSALRSPLMRWPLGARVVATIGLVLLQLAPSYPVRGEIPMSGTPSPAGATLRLIATGTPNAESIAAQVVEAAEKSYSYPLMPRLLDVLEAYSREGEEEGDRVSAALAIAEEHVTKTRSKDEIRAAAESLRLRLKNRPESVTPDPLWFHYSRDIPLDVPLTATSQAEWPMPVFANRMAYLLEQHLPRADRKEYVRLAFEAFLATTCETFLAGEVTSTCHEVGLFPMRYQVLALAFGGLGSDGTDPAVADVYLSQDPRTLDEVLEKAAMILPGGFSRQCRIIQKWRQKAPSRWEVWADLEPTI